jgi:hypothetical protein
LPANAVSIPVWLGGDFVPEEEDPAKLVDLLVFELVSSSRPRSIPFAVELQSSGPALAREKRLGLALLKPQSLIPGRNYKIVHLQPFTGKPCSWVDFPGSFGPGKCPKDLYFSVAHDRVEKQVRSQIVTGESARTLLEVESPAACQRQLLAQRITATLELQGISDRFRSAFLYYTRVDGEVWHPSPSVCDPSMPGRTWAPTGTDLFFTECSSNGVSRSPASLEPGSHTVEMRAWLPGTDLWLSASTTIALDCQYCDEDRDFLLEPEPEVQHFTLVAAD